MSVVQGWLSPFPAILENLDNYHKNKVIMNVDKGGGREAKFS